VGLSYSQNNKIDSLERIYKSKTGKDKILVLNDLAVAHWTVNLNKSLDLCNEALKLSDQYNFYKARARTLNIMGVTYYLMNDLPLAAKWYEKSLVFGKKYGSTDDVYKCLSNLCKLYSNGFLTDTVRGNKIFKEVFLLAIDRNEVLDFYSLLMGFTEFMKPQKASATLDYIHQLSQMRRVNQNRDLMAVCLNSEGFAYLLINDINNALKMYDLSLKEVKNTTLKNLILHNIGTTLLQLKKYNEAIEYYNEALVIGKRENSLDAFENASLEDNLGAAYLQKKDFKQSIIHLKNSLQIGAFTPTDRGVLYNNLGMAYLAIDSIPRSKQFLIKALALFDTLNLIDMKVGTLNSLATLYLKQKNNIELQKVINKIVSLIGSVQSLYIAVDSYKLLCEYYETRNAYHESFVYLKKWKSLNDSLMSKENLSAFNEFQAKYQIVKKDQLIQIQMLNIKNKNKILGFAGIAAIILLISLALILLIYRKKNQAYKFIVKQNLALLNLHKSGVIDGDFSEKSVNGMDNESIKYSQSNLTGEAKTVIIARLEMLIQKDKVFIKPDLTLNNLAEKCMTNRTYLSQILHEKYNMNFNSLINKYRVEEAMRMMADVDFDIPLKALHSHLGFNSNSTFYEVFRKYTGTSPSFYLKTVRQMN
jgi:tetratricopeptide (TPR) repeat protein